MKPVLYSIVALLLVASGCGSDSITNSSPTQDNLPKPTPNTPPATMVDYFPLEAGMVWTYGEGARVIRVTGKVRTLYGSGYMLEGLMQNRIVKKQDDGEVLELRGAELQLLFDLEAEEKASWRIETPGEALDLLDGTTVTVVSKSEVVEVPYGRFEGSIHLVLQPRPGIADAGITDMWFAPDVGLVKWSEIWIGGVRNFELTAFEAVTE